MYLYLYLYMYIYVYVIVHESAVSKPLISKVDHDKVSQKERVPCRQFLISMDSSYLIIILCAHEIYLGPGLIAYWGRPMSLSQNGVIPSTIALLIILFLIEIASVIYSGTNPTWIGKYLCFSLFGWENFSHTLPTHHS